jgi:hypothetical protein
MANKIGVLLTTGRHSPRPGHAHHKRTAIIDDDDDEDETFRGECTLSILIFGALS